MFAGNKDCDPCGARQVMPIPFSSHLSVSADVMVRQVGDEAVLLNLKTEKYLGLDGISNRIWQVLTTGATVQTAYDTLLSEFEVDPERLRKDLEEFVRELLEFGLVEQRTE
jgi:hypothetical protein